MHRSAAGTIARETSLRHARRGSRVSPAAAADAAAATRAAALEASLAAALDSMNVAHAAALADSAVALRQFRRGSTPLAVAAYLDSVALRFSALANAEGWAAAERCFERSLEIKQRAKSVKLFGQPLPPLIGN